MGRQKGNVAEREVAALLKEWWRRVEPDAEFVRVPLSGGWGGPAIRAGFKASGDVMTTAKCFPFTVEVKRREGWSYEWLIKGRASPVWGWWRQALGQAEEMDATPMLWFRKNREPWRVILPTEAIHRGMGAARVSFGPPVVHTWFPWEMRKLDLPFDVTMVAAESFLTLPPRVFLPTAKA